MAVHPPFHEAVNIFATIGIAQVVRKNKKRCVEFKIPERVVFKVSSF